MHPPGFLRPVGCPEMKAGGNLAEIKQQHQYVIVRIAKKNYTVNIRDIREIIRMQEMTAIPNSPAHIKGVINLRGIVIPVVSLRHKLGLGEEQYTKDTRILIVNHSDEMVGLIVDSVSKVTAFDEIEPFTDSEAEECAGDFFSGIGHAGGESFKIFNMDKVLHK
jgi:purine-binding chemotaxis protein CheW